MIVYGDQRRTEEPGQLLDDLLLVSAAVDRAGRAGPERHEAAARLLLDAGEFAQGVVDAAFARRGRDDEGEVEALCARLLDEVARGFVGSCAGLPGEGTAEVAALVGALRRADLPGSIEIKVPEGYAFYALYPELYAAAARDLRAEAPGEVLALGVRSIGTSLSAVVAAAVGAARPAWTLRPSGHPFQRTLAVGPAMARAVLAGRASATYAIVDEGPGFSGSSFGAVADWLEDEGVAPARVVFFPSHRGAPGAVASERHRARWQRARRYVVDFERVFLEGPAPRLASFLAGPLGGPVDGLEDVAGGRWRRKLYAREEAWPPVFAAQERRKYLVSSGGRLFLAKFAGLGRHGEAARDRAERLARAGFIPRSLGLGYGFLVSEWLGEARPLPYPLGEAREARAREEAIDRGWLVARVGDYLAFLAREFPAKEPGASSDKLLEMARYNAGLRLGQEVASELDRWSGEVASIEGAAARVCTDNKLHAWEWLALPDGRLLKADALDHHAAHDLIGAQDIAWDIAGASAELRMSEAERAALIERVERGSGRRVNPSRMPFYTACYLAFQMGRATMAASSLGDGDAGERARLDAACGDYAARLGELLGGLTGIS